MANERQYDSIGPIAFIADGGANGVVTVASVSGLRVKQEVIVSATSVPALTTKLEIKKVLSATKFIIGPIKTTGEFMSRQNLSAYTTANNATIKVIEQKKSKPTAVDIINAVYEQEPIVAIRTHYVDELGNSYNNKNPLPIAFDGTISVGKVQVEGENGNTIEPNSDGSVNVNIVTAPSANVIKNTFSQASAVAPGIETTITTYVVPVTTIAFLQRISVSGENMGQYKIYRNASLIDSRRTYFGGSVNENFEYSNGPADGYSLNQGDVITVKILHNRPHVGNFEARIQALEIP